MAEQDVAMLTMRRPDLAGVHPEDDELPADTWSGERWVDFRKIQESLLERRAVDVDSFSDAVRVAAFFYGQEDGTAFIAFCSGGVLEVSQVSHSDATILLPGARTKGKVRHPLFASLLGTLRIMWFAVRHPGRSAWIDHDTGEVWAADRTV